MDFQHPDAFHRISVSQIKPASYSFDEYYISKILVSLHLITGKKARQVFITNGIYVVITILGISYMMLDEGFEWIGWFSLAYLLCSATLSFAAGIGNYKLLTR